jgi:hypothetical protein
MLKVYSDKTITTVEVNETSMKTPRKSTINFLRNFARAYTHSAHTGTVILN